MSPTDQDYIRFDAFFGEEGEVTLKRVYLRKARKPHACFLGQAFGAKPHDIQPGDRYREERALVDGDYFGRYAMCLPCIDKELAAR
jgi:hypothetical protein